MGDPAVQALILSPSPDRHRVRFIELHIWGSIDVGALAGVVLTQPLTAPDKQAEWEMACTKLIAQGVAVADSTTQ